MGKVKRVVLGDFDRARLQTMASALDAKGFSTIPCENGADVLERCQSDPPDAVVLEVFLPRRNGFEVLKALKEDGRTAKAKVVVVIDESDDYGEHRARLCGADAILRRPVTADRVAAALKEPAAKRAAPAGGAEDPFSAVLNELEQRARAETPLIQHITDPLTGLYNAAYMDLKLAEEFKKARRFQVPLTCLLVELDEDEALGSEAARAEEPRLFNEIAGLFLCESRDIDHLARREHHEFLALLPHTDTAGASVMGQRLLASIASRHFELPGSTKPLTASAGIATFDGSEERPEDLLARARQALAVSQNWGGNRLTVWEPKLSRNPS